MPLIIVDEKAKLLDSVSEHKWHCHSMIILKQHPYYETDLPVMRSRSSIEVNYYNLLSSGSANQQPVHRTYIQHNIGSNSRTRK